MKPLVLVLLLVACVACTAPDRPDAHHVTGVEWLTNWPGDSVRDIALDYTDALANGFVIPSAAQVPGGLFTFRFHVRDAQGRRFAYKLYYQNTSYKFPEAEGSAQHPLAEENFYGSWENAGEGFRTTAAVPADSGLWVSDAFRIQGDPREEDRFVRDGQRQRWGRNPRVGRYRFMLVVLPAEALQHNPIPEAVRDIRRTAEGHFIEPFWYFLHGPGAHLPEVDVQVSSPLLAVHACPDALHGIHATAADGRTGEAFCASCGDNARVTAQAAWEQHIHHIDPATRFANIPLITDPAHFTYTDYAYHRAFTPRGEMIAIRPSVTRRPCSTVRVDSARHAIELRNPATRFGEWRKEDVAVRTRHPLTYGRYRVHVELPRLLNDSDVWNGLTNAIWLIGDGTPWGLRRPCTGGYLAHYGGDALDQRVPRSDYAEIDFEILKTVPYCPQVGFPPNYPQPVADHSDPAKWRVPLPEDVRAQRGEIAVACTNWDMACPQPEHFGVGCQPITYEGRTFESFRWDHTYRALTQKSMQPDAQLFGQAYWFEIDWRPESITWRIGPDLDHLRTVGFMDGTITSIPEVPMQLIISQEYHNTRWWPGSPYEQGFLPFSNVDHVGRVLEVRID